MAQQLNVTTSIVDYLKSKGMDSSLANRTTLGQQYGIDYSKTTDNYYTQNVALLKALQGGGAGASSGQTQNQGTDFSNVNNLATANSAINGNQLTDKNSVTADGTPATRKTTEQIMEELRKTVAPTTSMPASPNYTGTLLDYRQQYGVNDLETSLTQLQAEANDLRLQFQVNKNAETGKPVAMNVIEGRVGEHEKAANERLQMVNNSIQTVTSQLQTKYNIIDSLMKTKEMDYNSAVTSYDKQFSNNIALFNAAKGIEDSEKTELERQADNARANAQIIISTMNDRGLTYDQMSETEKINLTKLGVQSGLGANFFADVMKVSANKDILTTVVSADDTKATIIYKDGTTKTISTGLPAKPVSSSGDKLSLGDQKINAFTEMNMLLENPNAKTTKDEPVTTDGYLTPAGFLQLVKYGATKGITRDEIIGTYIDKFYIDPKTGEYATTYGLNQKEVDKYRPY